MQTEVITDIDTYKRHEKLYNQICALVTDEVYMTINQRYEFAARLHYAVDVIYERK